MSFGAAIVSALRKKKWRRSQYDVNDLGIAEVTCLSLTDLSNLPVPYKNTFVSRSEDNLLDEKLYIKSRNSNLKCKENWKRTSLNLSIDPEDEWKDASLNMSNADSAISLSFRDSVKCSRRPVSCYADYTSSREFLSVAEEANESSNTDFGYDSMNASSDSVLSLVRKSSIHDKSRKIMIKRRQFVKKRSRDSQVFSDDENNDLKYSKSNSQSSDNDISVQSKECTKRLVHTKMSARSRDEKCRSVHFDDYVEEDSFVKQQLTKSVSTLTLCRNNSVQLKSWQIRRQRRAMLNKHRRAIRQLESIKYEERLV